MGPISRIGKFMPLMIYLRKKRSLMASKFSSGVVLDVGCGPAEIVNYFPKEKNIKYVGIDTNKTEIDNLNSKYQLQRFFVVDVDTQSFPTPVTDLKFDTVLLLAVIEHLKCPNKLLEQISMLMNHNGKLIITTATPFGEHVHNVLAIFGLTSLKAIQEHKTSAHASYSTNALSDLVTPFGFIIDVCHKFEFGMNQIVVFKKK